MSSGCCDEHGGLLLVLGIGKGGGEEGNIYRSTMGGVGDEG